MVALYIICGLGVFALLSEIFNLKRVLQPVVITGLLVATVFLAREWNTSQAYYNNMLLFDNYAIAFGVILLLTATAWIATAWDFFSGEEQRTDRYALVIFSLAGGLMMISFQNLAMLFLGLEILSIPLYVLAGTNKNSLRSNEASFKYFLLGAFATGFFLMGIALVYGGTGSFDIGAIEQFILHHAGELPAYLYTGILLMFVGMAFKMSAVPFHFWAPDVYQGSPTIVTAYMSTAVKVAAIGAFLRIFSTAYAPLQPIWNPVLQVVVVLTLIIPNITALIQTNAKRILAYSSIGQLGFMLLAVSVNPETARSLVMYYLIAYVPASLVSFYVLHMLERNERSLDLEGFRGLFYQRPWLSFLFTVALLSLAGIPPLSGFFAKYLVLTSAVREGHVGLAVIAILTSLLSVYYYFRILIQLYTPDTISASGQLSRSSLFVVTSIAFLILLAGIVPDSILKLLTP